MPKRSERELYSKSFDTENPYEDMDIIDVYKDIQWGNNPKKLYEIESLEPLVHLGYLAELHHPKEIEKFSEKDYYLALGVNSNYLYIIPNIQGPKIELENIIDDEWIKGNEILETHYLSNKGGEECYYYHEHEKPFPVLWKHRSGVCILVPADDNGKRSYAVIKEGIIG